jgi:hypothetical protein
MNQAGDRPWMSIGPDRVTAQVRVPAGQFVTLSTLKDLLTSLGVMHGIDGQALSAISVKSSTERLVIVANGQPPPAINDRLVQLNSSVTIPSSVKAGDTIGCLSGEGQLFGRGVDGQALWPSLPATCGYGLMVSEDGIVRCACAGTLQRRTDGKIYVDVDSEFTPVEMIAVTIQVDSEKTAAHIEIPAAHYLPPHILHKALVDAKIVRGIIANTFLEASVAQAVKRQLTVACGIATRHGINGHVEMLIDDHIHLQVTTNGQVDYREQGRLNDVVAGTALARIMPPTLGEHGVDVYGAYLEPKPGRVLNPDQVLGEGAEIDPAQPDIIRTKETGHFHRDRNGRLCSQTRYTVEEHVDYHHGNINTKLSILIKGDIRTGFIVKSEGDIEVIGVVEDARVTAQGHLVIHGGILPGLERVKAHGDIDVKHVASRTLKCHDLRVTNSLRWSQVMATGEIVAKEILCGNIIAGGNITCDVVGNNDGLHTRLQAGLDPYVEELFACARREHASLLVAVNAHKITCKEKGKLAQEHQISDTEWQTALAEFSADCHRLATCEALIERAETERKRRATSPCKSVITVTGTAYRGTEIWLSDKVHIVLEKNMTCVQFCDKDGKVAW